MEGKIELFVHAFLNPETELEDGSSKLDSSGAVDEPSSPRGVLEIPVSEASYISDEQKTTDSCNSTSTDKSTWTAHGPFSYRLPWKGFLDLVRKKSVRKFSNSTTARLTSYDISRNSLPGKLSRIRSAEERIDFGLLTVQKAKWRNFGYEELAAVTDYFSPERLLGKGGHAEVYKGCLPDGNVVAVKKLAHGEKEDDGGTRSDEERTGDFLSELGIIAHVDHPNTAKLIGFGVEGGLFLVLQFCPHGSLASHLHGSSDSLEWKIRYNVALGVAEGLSYLHHSCQRRIIHRDIKASNILLAEDYEPLISDFGLAKWLPDKWLHHVVYPIEGTFGYLAPEYFMHGLVDEKTDVFAFGVLLLELITGRHAIDSSSQSLVMWAKPLLDSDNVTELADPKLGTDYGLVEIKRAMFAASLCIHHVASCRPRMNRVVQLLRGEGGSVLEVKQKPESPRSLLLDACDLEDYTCSNYLNDLNRHRELVME
ncbi:hypothetical protein Nepgr_027126 [Nepenthes gracilis]|uniref:non-specific serine/threonine protein kinase n=1 Tax=Nepenthes gracilis TaxID=150966 RepID=A0AAD3T9T7_NEPGR|nr:hypothetical protein Nepgr_027126 [Nepenthes gracilis]